MHSVEFHVEVVQFEFSRQKLWFWIFVVFENPSKSLKKTHVRFVYFRNQHYNMYSWSFGAKIQIFEKSVIEKEAIQNSNQWAIFRR